MTSKASGKDAATSSSASSPVLILAATPISVQLTEMVSQLQKQITRLEARLAAKTVKVKTLEPFDGQRSKLRGFLTQLELYFRVNRGKIEADSNKVYFISTYLTDRAFNWFELFIREYYEKAEKNQNNKIKEIFAFFDVFKRYLKQTFGDIDATRNVEQELWRLWYTGSVSKLASDFIQIIIYLDWDENVYIAKFEELLKLEIQEKLIQIERPDTLYKMIEQAVKIDNKLYNFNQRRRDQSNYNTPRNNYTGRYSANKKRYM